MSKRCTNPRTNKPRRSYFSESEAAIAADEFRARFGTDQVPYRCRPGCEEWHLGLRANHTPSAPCPDCTSSGGGPKMSYETEEGAQRRAALIRKTKGVDLRVYDCPYGNGWHLTSSW